MEDAIPTQLLTTALDRRHQHELAVVHAVIHEPIIGVEVARRVGVTDALFTRDDLQVLWRACRVAGERRGDVVAIATQHLAAAGNLADVGRPGLWSAAKVERFARHFSAIPATPIQRIVITIEAGKLIALHQRLRDAVAHLQHARALMEDAIRV